VSGVVVSIQTCAGDDGPMRPLAEVSLEPGGIPGDRHFAPGSARELLLIESETLEQLGLPPGVVRENLTVTGLTLMDLPSGARLRVGGAQVRITKPCEPCSNMEAIRTGLQAELVGRRGMLATVVVPGLVRRGDPVRVIEEVEASA
jgi:MOSC domain-containing protein YiiM